MTMAETLEDLQKALDKRRLTLRLFRPTDSLLWNATVMAAGPVGMNGDSTTGVGATISQAVQEVFDRYDRMRLGSTNQEARR